jgi:hypothetical protein
MSRVATNYTLSLELVASAGKAFPTLSTALPFLTHVLSTLSDFPSGFNEYFAVVFEQPL